jgi:Fic family protein
MQIEYIYNSNAIEGNTLTLRETQLVLEEGMTVGQRPLREIQEVKNHPEAIEYIQTIASKNKLTESDVFTIHQIIMRDIIDDAGRYRSGDVRIFASDHRPPPAYEVPFLIGKMLDRFNQNPDELLPIELAACLHHDFVHIHPFTDGNGRVARLLMNVVLLRFGYPMTTIRRVDRKSYYDCLQRADKGNLVPFVNFIASAVEQTLDLYLRGIGPADDQLIPISEASKGTPYSSEYLSLLVRTRKIPGIKTGRNWMVSKKMVQQYIEQLDKANSNDIKLNESNGL